MEQQNSPEPSQPCKPRLDDLAIYRYLLRLSAYTDRLSHRCWSPAASTALRSAAIVLRKLASALFRATLDKD